jgi:hypothetical protein
LRESLLKTVNPKDVNTSWRDDGYMVPAEGGEFGAGRITVAPAYFMQRQEVLFFYLIYIFGLGLILFLATSGSIGDLRVLQITEGPTMISCLDNIRSSMECYYQSCGSRSFLSWQLCIFSGHQRSLSSIKKNPALVDSWPSIFSKPEIIANCVIFSHRDAGGSPSLFDFLVSLGRNHHTTLALADLHAELDYSPGAMVYIAGQVLEYSVGPWFNGE